DLQPIFSFKLRGAYNKLFHLSAERRRRGVVAASAGNHAQGVALAARRLGIRALIVMPRTTPPIKVDAVARLGAETLLHGDSYDAAEQRARALARSRGLVLVPPYDDREIIAGQGTVAMELLRQHPDPLDALFVPVGGGGLIAGIAAYVKTLRPEIRIVGVEPEDAGSLHAALHAGRRVALDQVGVFADGVAVRQVGREPFRIARRCVDEVVLVSNDEICAAIRDLFEDTRAIAEPAGALAVAGLKRYVERHALRDASLVAVVSGANINFDRLRHVAERTELGAQREALLAVTIPERPGSFLAFCDALGERSITEFNYRFDDPQQAHVFAGVRLRGDPGEKLALVADLAQRGYPVVDLSDNELAKIHVRHMVGGHAPQVADEILYRFEFPERPGALLRFLSGLGRRWNISLFHYRNHGDAYGRVLVGIQVPAAERTALAGFLDELGYPRWEETGNPAYRLFAAGAD
ncbi:MAG TPA: threonine ammonia-lyase, biosynthetic, partial [Gammaproteobacteria bacterium]